LKPSFGSASLIEESLGKWLAYVPPIAEAPDEYPSRQVRQKRLVANNKSLFITKNFLKG